MLKNAFIFGVVILALGASAQNLADKNNVKVSEKAKEVKNLFDASHQTRWNSYYTKNAKASFTIDLGEEGKFNSVFVLARNLIDNTLEASVDGQVWKELGKLEKFGECGYGKFFGEAIKAKFVRINMTGPAKKLPIMVYELGVFDIVEPNKALFKNVKIVNKKNTNWRYPVEQAVDGNERSYFSTYSSWKGGTIELDLGKEENISSVEFINIGGALKSIEIFVSSDNQKWEKAGNAVRAKRNFKADFDTNKVRYLKFKIISGKAGSFGEIVVK